VSLLRFRDKPLDYAERLANSELGAHPFRSGDYRVIFVIESNDIVVLRTGDRKKIYKRK